VVQNGESAARDQCAGQVIELVASVLDGNIANQQQMHLLSGFSILGFLFQSVSPQLLNSKTLSALKYMFTVLKTSSELSLPLPLSSSYLFGRGFISSLSAFSGMSEILLRDALSQFYLNPHIWAYASYQVQRELYLFLIQYFEADGRFLPVLCALPRIIDVVRRFYSEKPDPRSSKPLLVSKKVTGERPSMEEIRKIRLLLLSLAEMSLK